MAQARFYGYLILSLALLVCPFTHLRRFVSLTEWLHNISHKFVRVVVFKLSQLLFLVFTVTSLVKSHWAVSFYWFVKKYSKCYFVPELILYCANNTGNLCNVELHSVLYPNRATTDLVLSSNLFNKASKIGTTVQDLIRKHRNVLEHCLIWSKRVSGNVMSIFVCKIVD